MTIRDTMKRAIAKAALLLTLPLTWFLDLIFGRPE